jgi:hypothetical protein
MSQYKSPRNAEDYWKVVGQYWPAISHILNLYLPTYMSRWIDGTEIKSPLRDYLATLRDAKDPKLIRAINAAMWACPIEDSGEWRHKDWNVLTDLILSECYIYEPHETGIYDECAKD